MVQWFALLTICNSCLALPNPLRGTRRGRRETSPYTLDLDMSRIHLGSVGGLCCSQWVPAFAKVQKWFIEPWVTSVLSILKAVCATAITFWILCQARVILSYAIAIFPSTLSHIQFVLSLPLLGHPGWQGFLFNLLGDKIFRQQAWKHERGCWWSGSHVTASLLSKHWRWKAE